jgi:hypothetical protein
MAVEEATVVDSAVGAFDDPASWLDDNAAGWLRAGYDVEGNSGLIGSPGDS